MGEFQNKVVIVTGASSGIGAATAKKFAERGASVVITGRKEEKLKKVVKACEVFPGRIHPVLANFENLQEVENVLKTCIERFGKLDILVNNAGLQRRGNLETAKMEDFDTIFNVNVKAPLYLMQIAMPHLLKTKGNIVNVSSLSSTKQFPSRLMYAMGKSALDQLTKTVALEYASQGVRVNSVNPSYVATDLYKDDGWSEEQIREFYVEAAGYHPMGRIGTTDEVANAIAFLASDASSWTTGQCLLLDGGRAMTVKQ